MYDCYTSTGNYSRSLQLDNTAIYRLEQFGESFTDAYMEYVDQLPVLPIRYLYLSTIHGLSTIHLATILFRCPYLIHLELDRCLINLIPIINILRFSCPQLEILSYHRNRYTQFPIATNATTTLNPTISTTNNNNNDDDESPSSSALSSSLSSIHRQQQRHHHHQNKSYSFLNRPHRLPMKLASSSSSSSMIVNNTKNNETSFWKQLSLKHSRTLTDELLHFILKGSYHTIEKLNIKENPRLTDDCLYQMIQRQQQSLSTSSTSSLYLIEPPPPSLPKLKEFDLSNCIYITEKGLCAFLKECPQLESIDLSGLPGVTDQVLYTMAIYCQQLTHIYLNHCKTITDHGIKQFIHIFLQRKMNSSTASLFQRLELDKTNLSMECLGYAMCYIERDGI